MPTLPPQDNAIIPVDFTPLDSTASLKTRRLKPLALVLIAALLTCLLVLGYLLGAKTLIVQTTPANAAIEVSGFSFRLSGNFLVWPGQYDVSASAKGYITASQTVKVGDASSQKLNLQLQKMSGHLDVITHPAGAEIFINDKPVGSSPFVIKDLAPASYQLSISKPRFKPFVVTVDIEGLDLTEKLEAQLQPAWGNLVINSEPTGATVTVGDQVRGSTPLTTELLSEGESVSIKLPGHKQWQQQLSVVAGQTLEIPTIKLQPADGLLMVASNPQGASITANGKFLGVTPIELQLTPTIAHKLRFFLDGYQTLSKTVQLQSGVEQSLTLNLSPQQAKVRILVEPKNAEIRINGKVMGRSDQTFNLPAKAHQLEVVSPGFATDKRTITPRVGIEQVLQISLKTEQQARWANTPKQIKTQAGQTLKLFRPNQTFTMGASRREAGRRANEVIREVKLERAFYLATTPVTNGQFKRFNRKHSSSHAAGNTLDTARQPVINISWQQAASYCNGLSAEQNLTPFYTLKDGKITGTDTQSNGYRLPTEAEWAWAARVENNNRLKFPWGSGFPPGRLFGNYADKSASNVVGKILVSYQDGFAVSAPVGSFSANSKGLFDLGHNVMEWVNDFYGIESSLSLKAVIDPLGPEQGEFHVIRGASWRDADITTLRLSYRDYGQKGKNNLGFRVARYVE